MGEKKDIGPDEFIEYLMNTPALRNTLSHLGVFVVDYRSKRALPNDQWKELGLPDTQMWDLSWTEEIHPDDRKRVAAAAKEFFEGSADRFREVYRVRDTDGRWHWISNKGALVWRTEEGKPWIYIGADEDMTRIKTAQEEASQRAREAGTLTAAIEVITSSLDLEETVHRVMEQARRVVPYDRATIQILHDGHLEILGGLGFADVDAVIGLRFPYPEEGSLSTRAIRERRPWKSDDLAEDFPKFRHVESSSISRSWIGVPLIAHGDVIGLLSLDSVHKAFYTPRHMELARAFAGPVAIALENARLHEETYRLAMEDALTGIGSRHAFELNSRFLYEKARREERMLSMAMLDLDRFKEVNDDYGHQAGDRVLIAVAAACFQDLRASDILARYGGEEIAILFPDTEPLVAGEIVERIRYRVADLRIDGVDRRITVSAGVTGIVPRRDTSLTDLIREADTALYRAKANGRDRVMVTPAG